MASPGGKAVLDQLAALNDELCFFLFAAEEMSRGLRRFSPALDTVFSTDLFSDNPEARRIHVPLSQLRQFQRVHGSSTYYSYFSTSYEVAATYYSQCTDFLTKCGVALGAPGQSNHPEVKFGNQIAPIISMPREVLETLQYMRIRRNHWIHRSPSPKQIWLDLASQSGSTLNMFWGITRGPLDFTKANQSSLQVDEVIALIKLIRVCIQRIDDMVMSSVPLQGLLVLAAREKWGVNVRPANSQVLADRAKQLCGIVLHQFGISANETDALQAMQSV